MYTPLQNLSSFSLLDSSNKIDELIKDAKDKGYTSLALTDKNTMYATIDFYHKAIDENIKPIIGLTIDFNYQSEQNHYELLFIAKNNNGYKNLMQISTYKMTHFDDYFDINDISDYLDDIFILIPKNSELLNIINNQSEKYVDEYVEKLINHLNLQNLKIGIGIDYSDFMIDRLKEISKKYQIDLIALNSVKYLKQNELFANKVLNSIGNNRVIDDPIYENQFKGDEYLKSSDEMDDSYLKMGLKNLLENNNKLSNEVDIQILDKEPKLPVFDTPDGYDSQKYLRHLCEIGLSNKNLDKNRQEEYQNRLSHELDVIDRMQFNDYFLVVQDVINFAHHQNIITGPGRGSAAGSLVAYSLGITGVDPIKNNLLFERFLNEDRAQMPDIDLDVPDNRREDILKFIHQKYGADRVAQIVTFGTLSAKQVIRDVGRVFGLNQKEMSNWSSSIPSELNITLESAKNKSQKLINLISDSKKNKLLFETALKLEGLPRHYSIHAAGLIISENPIVNNSPLQNGRDGLLITQYSKKYVENVGLLKFDFLGLKNLSILGNIIDLVHITQPNFNIDEINFNDPKTLNLFIKGNTNGIFQFESNGIKNVLRQLKPTNFDLVAAVNALYRPGPMENIDTFIKRKNGIENITYPADSVKPILESTFGIIVYQEQVMQLASVMAGFTLGQADILRRAMSKKDKYEMDQMRNRFIDGSMSKGYSNNTAVQVFDYIDRFANYGFNKSHAYAYTKMAFELAYLKANFPGEFFVSLLNSVVGNYEKEKKYIQEAKNKGIEVNSPNINLSQSEFKYKNKKIIFGFNSIKSLRSDFIKDILIKRENGSFKDLKDFIHRIDEKYRKEDLIKPLVYVGALDEFNYNRAELIQAIPELINSIELSGNSIELFEVLAPKIERKDDFSLVQKLDFENEYLGLYLSGHPVEQYQKLKEIYPLINTSELNTQNNVFYILLYILNVRVIRTKKGQKMAFVKVNDQYKETTLVVFPDLFKKVEKWLNKEIVLLVQGKNDGEQIIANELMPAANLKSELEKKSKKLYLLIETKFDNPEFLKKILEILRLNSGSHQVIMHREKDNSNHLLANKFNVNLNESLIKKLNYVLGESNIKIN
ncbi:DNA polymerase III subunit alpha [Lactobacillus sp. S2-2]|uniref:DNA polymerase III subunit alpha n=1 Tax=Lactobacillus sp. S2-2 TaxID=2692917 RepID=UPI001F9CAB8A|nr:DNA polymerase III subunit alpha [Lactobacillus sp. S2-2]